MLNYHRPIIGIKYDKPTIYIIKRNEDLGKITKCRVPVRELLKPAPRSSSVDIAAGLIDAHTTWFMGIKVDQVVGLVERIRRFNDGYVNQ
jgi:hypothetical protein